MAQPTPSTPDLQSFHTAADPGLIPEAHQILTKYSGIADSDLIQHVRAVRVKAWSLYPYPCIDKFSFLTFSISSSPDYPQILQRVKSDGHKLLDLGCCFGQDIRKLVFDGAPPQDLCWTELEHGFVEMGYELFCDRGRLGVELIAGDVFDAGVVGKLGEGRGFDIIHAASFFHLFGWDEQVEVLGRAVRLLRPVAGFVIFGRQLGVREAGEVSHSAARSGVHWRHDEASFRRMVGVIAGKTGVGLECEVGFVDEEGWKGGERWGMLRFCVRVV